MLKPLLVAALLLAIVEPKTILVLLKEISRQKSVRA